jgi:hypothetical protein
MTSISNGESGSSVRTKLNSSLTVTDAFTVSGANVGIGGTPTAALDVVTQVAGALGISLRGRASDNVADFSLKSNDAATVYGQIQGRSTDLRISGVGSLPVTVYTGSTPAERMRIDASGNVGIGAITANAASIVDAQSTTKGVRFPNMTTAQKTAIANVAGNVVFDTTLGKLCVNSGSGWQTITSV